MKKWILIISGTLIVIIVIILCVGLSNLGPLIKNAVNTYGPPLTKTEVRLDDVSISLFSGEARLKNFYLGNPAGFNTPQAMQVGSIHVDLDEKSLTSDTIIIDKIEVVRPKITYEKKRRTDNFQTILNNMTQSQSRETSSTQKTEEESAGKKILIRTFIVRGGKVNLIMSLHTRQSISASLPDIHLKDVGGTSPAKTFKEVFSALYKNIISPSVTDTLNQAVKALDPGIKAAGDDAKKGVGAATDKVKGLFGKKK